MSNGNKKLISKKHRREGNSSGAEGGASEQNPQSNPQAKEAPGGADEGAEAVLGLLESVKDDVDNNVETIAGMIVVVSWKDGTLTSGWTGGFNLENTAGKLFNLATDFSVASLRNRSLN